MQIFFSHLYLVVIVEPNRDAGVISRLLVGDVGQHHPEEKNIRAEGSLDGEIASVMHLDTVDLAPMMVSTLSDRMTEPSSPPPFSDGGMTVPL